MVKVDQLLWQAPYWAMPVHVSVEAQEVKMVEEVEATSRSLKLETQFG